MFLKKLKLIKMTKKIHKITQIKYKLENMKFKNNSKS